MSPPFPQIDAAGRLRHLVTLDGLPRDAPRGTARRAPRLHALAGAARGDALRGVTVANLFGEPSTRTRASFELAALRQGADVVNLDNALSSRAKGETLLDTVLHAARAAVDVFVMRDARARRAGAGRARRRRRGAVVSARRGAPVAPDPGPARRADDPPGEGRLRPRLGRDRRRHRPLARRALRAPRARDPRRAGHPHRGAARDDAGGRRNSPAPAASSRSTRASRAPTSS